MQCMSTKFYVNSSCFFFLEQGYTRHTVTDATDYPTHNSDTSDMGIYSVRWYIKLQSDVRVPTYPRMAG